MYKNIMIGLMLLLFTCSMESVYAQNKSTTIEVIEGKKYYIHEVKKGETLYGIAKTYQVSMDAIAYENPEIFNGIKPGDKLRIPIQATPSENKTHTVQKGETLYGIAKMYKVTVEEIVQKNPDASNGIKVGQSLIIPVHQVASADYSVVQSNKETPIPKKESELSKSFKPDPSKHIVQKGETIYGITKQFKLSEETLYKLNPDLKTVGLVVGQEIYVKPPALLYPSDTTSKKISQENSKENIINTTNNETVLLNTADCNTLLSPVRTIKVALLIPLGNDIISLDEEESTTDIDFKPVAKPYLEFYEGFLMALDSIRKQGLSVELLQYDIKHDSSKIKQILNDKAMQDVDLIIGPFNENIFEIVAVWAEKKHINVIDPLNTSNHALYNYSNVIQLNTSLVSQIEQEVRYFASFDSVNISIIKSGNSEESQLISIYKKNYMEIFAQNFPQKTPSLKEIVFNQSGDDTNLDKVLDNDKINVVFIPSSSQTFVLNVINKLNDFTKNDKIILSYLPSWKKFEQNFELEHLFNLHTYATHCLYINYEEPDVKRFVMDYRFLYKIEPSKFSFLGYDGGIYFLTLIQKYGKSFQSCINSVTIHNLSSHFYFKKVNKKGGYENTGIYLTRFNENTNDVTVSNIITDKIILPLSLPYIELRKVGIQK